LNIESKSNSIKAKSRTNVKSQLEQFFKSLHDHSYSETFVILGIYLSVGYLIDPEDICLVNGEVPYILIILALITLFHGFENGILAIFIIAVAMWIFYEVVPYLDFLIALMITMINGEFHFYWTKKIDKAEINSKYSANKLDELSKSFYSLKISHDQLEKNYVVKPMSIRNSIEEILSMNLEVDLDDTLESKNHIYYANFLGLLEKSFNVNSAVLIYKMGHNKEELFSAETVKVVFGAYTEEVESDLILKDYLVDKSLGHQIPVYVSDESGDPSATLDTDSDYIAAIPSVIDGELVAILAIKRMPFMSFNREVLTSITILLEYFSIEIGEKNILEEFDSIKIIPEKKFRFEYARLRFMFVKNGVDTTVLVFKMDNELQSVRVYERVKKMLRSLDRVTVLEANGFYYIILLFPLHDKAAAEGYYNRLMHFLKDDDAKFDFMIFSMMENELLNKYLREDARGYYHRLMELFQDLEKTKFNFTTFNEKHQNLSLQYLSKADDS